MARPHIKGPKRSQDWFLEVLFLDASFADAKLQATHRATRHNRASSPLSNQVAPRSVLASAPAPTLLVEASGIDPDIVQKSPFTVGLGHLLRMWEKFGGRGLDVPWKGILARG